MHEWILVALWSDEAEHNCVLSCSGALGSVLSKWRSEMSAHVAIQVGDAGGDEDKFVPRTLDTKAEYEAWLKRKQAKPKTHRAMLTSGGANGTSCPPTRMPSFLLPMRGCSTPLIILDYCVLPTASAASGHFRRIF